jgi:hypothetical protein
MQCANATINTYGSSSYTLSLQRQKSEIHKHLKQLKWNISIIDEEDISCFKKFVYSLSSETKKRDSQTS